MADNLSKTCKSGSLLRLVVGVAAPEDTRPSDVTSGPILVGLSDDFCKPYAFKGFLSTGCVGGEGGARTALTKPN